MVLKSSTLLTHEDYTIGWVCALPKELAAASYMLDSIHQDLYNPTNDSNAYTLGNIDKHNVVIACLPMNRYGNNSAATTASRMMATFPNIGARMMIIGIGGGIGPVQLGDVVVSCPKDGYPGVIQWDMGKTEKDGKFRRTAGSRAKIFKYLDDLKNREDVPESYIKSDKLKDVLYESKYNHVSKNPGKAVDDDGGNHDARERDLVAEDCQHCDPKMIVDRELREKLEIHYGLILSGNQVIKDAAFRDKLSDDFDHRVLCIEMEAAGLANDFPCIVIRGICDYADTHKNKVWQEYAAATAAAYAKALLTKLPVTETKKNTGIVESAVNKIVKGLVNVFSGEKGATTTSPTINESSQLDDTTVKKSPPGPPSNDDVVANQVLTPPISPKRNDGGDVNRAVENGHEATLQPFPDTRNVTSNSRDNSRHTPPLGGAGRGNEGITRPTSEPNADLKRRQTFRGQGGDALSAALSPDMGTIASSMAEGKDITIWDVSGKVRWTLRGHDDCIWALTFSSDSKLLASGSVDRDIRIWDVVIGKCLQTIHDTSEFILAVSFSPDSKMLASGADDRNIKIWDVVTGECKRTLKGHKNNVSSLSFSPDSKYVASGSDDKSVKIWDATTGECQWRLQGHEGFILSVVFSPHSKLVASSSRDKAIKIWDIATGKLQQTLSGHEHNVSTLAFSPDSKLVASGSDDKTVKIWDSITGQCQRTFRGHPGAINSMAFALDSKLSLLELDGNDVRLLTT